MNEKNTLHNAHTHCMLHSFTVLTTTTEETSEFSWLDKHESSHEPETQLKKKCIKKNKTMFMFLWSCELKQKVYPSPHEIVIMCPVKTVTAYKQYKSFN